MRPNWLSSALLLLPLLAVAGAAVFWWWRPQGPPPRPPSAAALVDDGAGLMSPDQRSRLAEHHAFLLADHGIDYRVVTGRALGDLDLYAAERYRALAIGAASASKRGLLLAVDADSDRVRLEVGYGLEATLPDGFVAFVEQRQMVPFFAAGRVADGILATTELIVTRVQRAKAGGGYEGELWLEGSGGAGAATAARLEVGPAAPATGPAVPAAGDPRETVRRYLEAMAAGNADPSLDIYAAATRTLLRDWVVTRAQMKNLVETYAACRPLAPALSSDGGLAVIAYPVENRACAPWFLRREAGAWRLDLSLMGRVIRFGRDNAWRLERTADHPYRYAFDEWRFDKNGFPLEQGRPFPLQRK